MEEIARHQVFAFPTFSPRGVHLFFPIHIPTFFSKATVIPVASLYAFHWLPPYQLFLPPLDFLNTWIWNILRYSQCWEVSPSLLIDSHFLSVPVIHLLYSFKKYFLSLCSGPGTVLGIWDMGQWEKQVTIPAFMEVVFQWREKTSNNKHNH